MGNRIGYQIGEQSVPSPGIRYYRLSSRGGMNSCHAWPYRTVIVLQYEQIPLHPCNAGMEHVGFPSTGQGLFASSMERREVILEGKGFRCSLPPPNVQS